MNKTTHMERAKGLATDTRPAEIKYKTHLLKARMQSIYGISDFWVEQAQI